MGPRATFQMSVKEVLGFGVVYFEEGGLTIAGVGLVWKGLTLGGSMV